MCWQGATAGMWLDVREESRGMGTGRLAAAAAAWWLLTRCGLLCTPATRVLG